MRFQFHSEEMLNGWPEVHRAYISGLDGRVYPTRVEIDGSVVACRRRSSDSGKLNVAWPVEGFGRPIIATCTLREQETPFLLALELARGKISQVRNQVAAWETAGMTVCDAFRRVNQESLHLFGRAISLQDKPVEASEVAQTAIVKAFEAAELLAQTYTQQRLALRRKRTRRLPASLGCGLAHSMPRTEWHDMLSEVFTTIGVPVDWRCIEPEEGQYDWKTPDAQVQWCEEHRMLICGGPLLDFSRHGLPEWLEQWAQDFDNLKSFLCDFVETAVTRYVGKIRLWEVSARVGTGGALNLTEEDRLALAAHTLEVAGQVDEESQLLIRIDQPWGEYQARGRHRLSPLQFVDALVRCGTRLSGVNLELCIGTRPFGTASRDLLDFSRLIDQWSVLELPLYVTLGFPSSLDADSHARAGMKLDVNSWRHPWCESAQADWIRGVVPLLMAKQSVVGILWTHLSDADAHDFPNAGLLRSNGDPKPALHELARHGHTQWP